MVSHGFTTASYLEDVSVPRPGQSMAFVMDTRMCDGAFELAQGVDLLVCESTPVSMQEADDVECTLQFRP